jgi:16S rRNA (adenine1518-N6/adenine1519-N6)-dimethyltransferase
MSGAMNAPKKSLGQHWLNDPEALADIVGAAAVDSHDIVLEIGPGLGTLTRLLVEKAERVVAVEFDEALARKLATLVTAPNLEIVHQDILSFDLTSLPPGYKVVANIPYYLTSNLIRTLSESANPPIMAVLLVQKEVAERAAAVAGSMSILGVTAQFYWQVSVGAVVPAVLFTPPPKVDSRTLILKRRDQPLFAGTEPKQFFSLVKAGFGQRRKTLLNALGAGLRLSREDTEQFLRSAQLDPGARAQTLSLEDWQRLYVLLSQ